VVRAAFAVCFAALVCAGSSTAARTGGPTTQDVTITGAGGVQLACEFVLPAGTPPDGGWPGLVIFPGGSGKPVDGTDFAAAGFVAVSCSERGLLSSGGAFDLAGPQDAKDAQAIFDWLAARPEVSETRIGAEGSDLGGAEVWNATVAGVPFKAIVTSTTWSSLRTALKPTGVLNARLFQELGGAGLAPWNTPSGIAARSYTKHLHSLAIPTLILNSREDYFFDLSQDTVPYGLLSGPKRLLIGWQGGEDLTWFRHYLAGGPRTGTGTGVVLEHQSPDTASTHFLRLPPTRVVSANLPGAALTRSVFLTGGPLETFGGGNVTIRYSGASWTQVVATVSTASGKVVTEGAAVVQHSAGVLKIPLMNEVMLLRRGKKLTVTLSSHDATFGGTAAGHIAVQRVSLNLSVLQRTVSH
jgi:X-Pro dipeptidyl-peptidase (S15 family)